MKRLVFLILTILFLLCLTACGGSKSGSKSAVNELEVLKPIAVKQEIDEKHYKEAIDLLKKLGVDMTTVSVEDANLGTIWVSSPEDCHQQDYQLQLLFFTDTKELYRVDVTGYQEKSPGKQENTIPHLFVYGKLYDKRNGGIWHKLSDLYITKDRQAKMEKAITKNFLESWNDAKIVKKYIVPIVQERDSKKKEDVQFLYIALVEYKRKFYGGESTGQDVFEAYFDEDCKLLTYKYHKYGSGTVTNRRDNHFLGLKAVNDHEIFTWSQTRKKAKSQEVTDNKPQQPSHSSNNNAFKSTEGIITGNDVNVRKGPGVTYDSLGVFFKGDKVRLVDIDNSTKETWYKIEYDNPKAGLITGWVRSDFINTNVSHESNSSIPANAIVDVKHSSADNEDGYNHSGALTTDGDTKTCWAEGVPGLGINENITYYFNGNYKVSGLNIWTGHQKSEDLFYKNARPTAIRVTGSDGSSVVYQLTDTMGMQRVTFNQPITANSIKLVVEKVAPGTKYEDTCIAEVNFF